MWACTIHWSVGAEERTEKSIPFGNAYPVVSGAVGHDTSLSFSFHAAILLA